MRLVVDAVVFAGLDTGKKGCRIEAATPGDGGLLFCFLFIEIELGRFVVGGEGEDLPVALKGERYIVAYGGNRG